MSPAFKSYFDKNASPKLTGISISMVEKLFDTKVQSKYYLDGFKGQSHNTCSAAAVFKFGSSGSIDIFKLISESVDRLNDLVKNITGDVDE